MCVTGIVCAPAYIDLASAANEVLKMQGGARLSEKNTRVLFLLEQQIKRVAGLDPQLDLNISSIRDMGDKDLLRVLLLAVLGNFTTAQGSEWDKPCSVVIHPKTGNVMIHDTTGPSTVALKVLLVLLCAIQVRQWVYDEKNAKKDKIT